MRRFGGFRGLASVRVRLRVAVRAQQAKVFAAVVVVDAVDVVEVQRQLLAAPVCDTAVGTRIRDPGRDETLRDPRAVVRRSILHKYVAVRTHSFAHASINGWMRVARFTARPPGAAEVARIERKLLDPVLESSMRPGFERPSKLGGGL